MRVFNILVIGGYGRIGSCICERLVLDETVYHGDKHNIAVMIAGRNDEKAALLAGQLRAKKPEAEIKVVKLDINSPELTRQIAATSANLVIHTAGPFQKQDYRVAKASINAGAHYIDVADASDYVLNIKQLDFASAHDLSIISGAGTSPALFAAVIDQLVCEFKILESIDYGYTPGYSSGRGTARVKSILAGVGRPFTVWRDGDWKKAYGWQQQRVHNYRKAIKFRRLRKRWLANLDVPDMQLFPERYAGVNAVRFGTGIEIGFFHRILWYMSFLSRMRLIWNWRFMGGLINTISCWFNWSGSKVSGLFVEISGEDFQNRPKRLHWALAAGSGHGPYIAAIPAVILARKLAHHEYVPVGAQICTDLVRLDEIMREIKELDIKVEKQSN
ncbi:MAG: saccharopine dehydrogenase NADP-binding domain-containing protein [Gammaproteobacteria bacterium]|nr:saccharopine dehydrogenase NADP-binding domain-containing protein [Gammaproteobacteria bacterium]